MKVKLIPVIEIFGDSDNILHPDKYPYWVYPNEFELYNKESMLEAGFVDMKPAYAKGSSFYRLPDLNDANLLLAVKRHIGDYKLEEVCPFLGGYVLNIDGEDILFPQCCGDLSDIQYWRNIASGILSSYEGHPAPDVKFKNEQVILLFADDEEDGAFAPKLLYSMITLEKKELMRAVMDAEEELLTFSNKLIKLNTSQNLSINNIEKLLVYESY